MKHLFLALSFSGFILCALSTCDEDSQRKLDDLNEQVGQSIGDAQNKISDTLLAPEKLASMTEEQVDKLLTVEYRVIDFPKGEVASELEQQLAALGKERWDCFQIMDDFDRLRVVCKRQPKSTLRSLGQLRDLFF